MAEMSSRRHPGGPTAPLTPERRRQQTRDYLLEAAAKVFAERGFQGASLDEVAAAAGFTKGAVYSNFGSKDELILALLEARYEEEIREVRATVNASEAPFTARVPDFVDLVWRMEQRAQPWLSDLRQEFVLYARRNPEARRKLSELERQEAAAVAEIIEAERKRLDLKDVGAPETLAWIMLALFQGISAMAAINPDLVDERFMEATLSFVSRALGEEPLGEV
jgi:AcrR family transcriptional regulator